MTESIKTASAPVKNARHATGIAPDLSISAGWGTISGGNIIIYDPVLTLNDNGTGAFTGQIEGTAEPNGLTIGFGLHDINGVELYRVPGTVYEAGTGQTFSLNAGVAYPGYMCAYLTTIVLYQS